MGNQPLLKPKTKVLCKYTDRNLNSKIWERGTIIDINYTTVFGFKVPYYIELDNGKYIYSPNDGNYIFKIPQSKDELYNSILDSKLNYEDERDIKTQIVNFLIHLKHLNFFLIYKQNQ